MYANIEKRNHKRINKCFTARFKERNIPGWDIVTLRNLSAGGAIFNYNRRLDVGSLLDFKVDFPIGENPITCSAKVIRVDEPFFPPTFGIATEFTSIEGRSRELISRAGDTFLRAYLNRSSNRQINYLLAPEFKW